MHHACFFLAVIIQHDNFFFPRARFMKHVKTTQKFSFFFLNLDMVI